MQRPKTSPSQELITIAERILSETLGDSVQLIDAEDLQGGSRSYVYRFNVLGRSSSMPKSVIVKQAKSSKDSVYVPDKATLPAWTFFNEWASLQFLNELAPENSLAPHFYGGDRATGVIVMEDMGHGMRLDQLLMNDDSAAAESALVEFATIHGQLHALTMSRKDEFNRLRVSLGPTILEDGHYTYDWLIPTFYQTIELLGVTSTPEVERELAMLKASVTQPGPFLTFVQQDSCPDNCLFMNSTLRLLDFEGGRLDHALKGGVYGRMRFPTCWCVYQLPKRIPLQMEAAYRAELVKGCPVAADDTLFYRAVAEMCVYWLIEWYQIDLLAKLLEKDRFIAAATGRQRHLMRSDVVAETTEEFGHMKAIGATIRAMAIKMRALWPDVEDTPYYPAFR